MLPLKLWTSDCRWQHGMLWTHRRAGRGAAIVVEAVWSRGGVLFVFVDIFGLRWPITGAPGGRLGRFSVFLAPYIH